MKKAGTALTAALLMLLAACGNGSRRNDVNGAWKGDLVPIQGGATPMSMTVALSVNATDHTLSGSILSISGDGGCLSNPTAPTGTFVTGPGATGQPTSIFDMDVNATVSGIISGPDKNDLHMSGTLSDGNITGGWLIQGVCNENGTFILKPVPGPYLPKGGS